ncbi:MAG: hypothetical protein QF486_02200 [Candidatus Woesearchaeota archaeon]|jgi:drug/metabolite transporter (DMT)-like permease|nr:hypothetical protein [Candidatus Woesearchaeota archaeon]MDP7180974.1 hypothetical protein [Candidatus Woesearchaeota archaeon]MDP7198405.1 hypothetical protein [Candidatus Woesearchaeota archaeon]MDP7467506.1 hypothetical protein [Candidatus Woesearchaeota archaeon]
MRTPSKLQAVGLVILCTFVTSTAQIFWKTGADLLPTLSWHIPVGLAMYGLGAAILIYALTGGELTLLYPVIATSYIWVNILAFFLFQEPLTVTKWVGIASIIAGLAFVGKGGQRD